MDPAHPKKKKRIRPGNRRLAAPTDLPRAMCFLCMRPSNVCHCESIPRIKNRTKLLIAQHIRERSHPFNTARMVYQALENVELIVDYSENMHHYSDLIGPGTGLLYPGPDAIDIRDLPVQQRPKQLLLLDGTWNQVKRLYRYWPQLKQLPHYKISPESPGEYRIRLEPNEYSLSTVEATVAALQLLEPETDGLGRLLEAFRTMIDRQLAHPQANYSQSSVVRKRAFNVPNALLSDERPMVLAYGEAEPLKSRAERSKQKRTRTPVVWVAQRFGSGETFHSTIESTNQVTTELLDHFDLPATAFDSPRTAEQFRAEWQSFRRPDDVLVVYNSGSLKLLEAIGGELGETILLRSINYDPEKQFSTLQEFFSSQQFERTPPVLPGRAGMRLANMVTLLKCLRKMKRDNV